jgi:hypothetical protein
MESMPGVFVSDIRIYDFGRDVSIHSPPMDKEGRILDATLGAPASGGCVQVAESATVFRFAQMGTRIWIH